MNEKEINYILDNININEHEFNHIDIELNDIERKRIRKNYRKAINKKTSIIKKFSIACTLVLTIGAIYVTPIVAPPAMASNIPILSTIYETLGVYKEYKDYTTYIGQSITVSNYTYTIDNMMVTPYNSLIAIKITSTEPIPEDHEGFMIDPSIGGVHWNSGSSDKGYMIDDHNMITFIKHDYINKVPKKSTIKININSMDSRDDNTNTSGKFEFKADFNRSYTEFTSLPVKNANIDKFGVTIKEIRSSIMETDIVSEGYDQDKLELLLNVDGKIYGGLQGTFSGKSSRNVNTKCTLVTNIEGLNVNTINNAKNISLLIYEAKYSGNESTNFRESLNEPIQQPDNIEEQNVFFPPYYNFFDGHKGEFYNLERDENTIRIHYKGKSGDIIPLCGINAWYNGVKKANFSKVIPNSNDKSDFTLEFNNVPLDKKIDISFINMDHIFNDYTLLDTVKVK